MNKLHVIDFYFHFQQGPHFNSKISQKNAMQNGMTLIHDTRTQYDTQLAVPTQCECKQRKIAFSKKHQQRPRSTPIVILCVSHMYEATGYDGIQMIWFDRCGLKLNTQLISTHQNISISFFSGYTKKLNQLEM